MSIIPILIVASLALAGTALIAFIWAVRTGQFDDTFTPSIRILTDHREAPTKKQEPKPEKITKQNLQVKKP